MAYAAWHPPFSQHVLDVLSEQNRGESFTCPLLALSFVDAGLRWQLYPSTVVAITKPPVRFLLTAKGHNTAHERPVGNVYIERLHSST